MDPNLPIFTWIARAVVLFTAMPIHECAHGYAADRLGDDTARRQGRLTLNPLRHLDPVGSLLIIFAGFGWAKPVPVDPRNFKNRRSGMAITSLAGPLSNILFAALLTAVLQIVSLPYFRNTPEALANMLLQMILTNLYLAVFNLLPIPPLDGSKVVGAILPERLYFGIMRYERYIAPVLVLLIVTGVLTRPLQTVVLRLFHLLVRLTSPIAWYL